MTQTIHQAVGAEPAEEQKKTAVAYLTPQNAKFTETAGRMLKLDYEGKEYPRVQLHRSFPHSDSRKFISVRSFDPEKSVNDEIGLIRDMDDFDEQTAELLEKFLELRYFAPRITKLLNIKDEFGYTFWDTETDQGGCRFVVRKDSRSIIHDTGGEVLVVDVDGDRFVVPDVQALSDKEMKLIELYL